MKKEFNNCLYVGKNVEEREKSITLFVADKNATFNQIKEAALANKVVSIYFGAGETYEFPSSLSEEELNWLADNFIVHLEFISMIYFYICISKKLNVMNKIICTLNMKIVPEYIKIEEEDITSIVDMSDSDYNVIKISNDHFLYDEDRKV